MWKRKQCNNGDGAMHAMYKLLKAYDGKSIGDEVQCTIADAEVLVAAGIFKHVRDLTDEESADADADAIMEPIVEKLTATIAEQTNKAVAVALGKVDSRLKVRVGVERETLDPMCGFKSFNQFATDVANASKDSGVVSERLVKMVEHFPDSESKAITGMGETVGEDGGWLVPPEVSQTIYEKAFPETSLLGMSDQYTVSGNTLEFNSVVENSRASGSRHGGVRGYWLAEGEQLTGSKPKFSPVNLRLQKLAVLIYATQELLDDSATALEQFLTRKASQEIAFMVSDAIFNGDGNGKPQGILQSNALITVAKESSQPADTVVAQNIIKMWSRIPLASRANAVWFINQDVEQQLDQMFLPAKNVAGAENVGGWPVYMPPGGLSGAGFGTLKGRPVMPIEWAETLGDKGDIVLADLGQYATIAKGGVNSSMSMHLRFDWDETAFKFTFRVDGQSWYAQAVTPYKGTTTLSPFVTLAARA